MSPSSWTVTDWLIAITFVSGGIGVILKGQHSLITGLLKDKWDVHERRVSSIEERVDDHDDQLRGMGLKVNTLEAVCRLRHFPRPESSQGSE